MFKPQRSTLSEVVKSLGVTGESNRFWVRTPSPMAGLTHPPQARAHLPLQAEARLSRLFGGCFVVVHSLGARTLIHHVWWAIVESMRTWIIERNFPIPPLFIRRTADEPDQLILGKNHLPTTRAPGPPLVTPLLSVGVPLSTLMASCRSWRGAAPRGALSGALLHRPPTPP